MTTTQPSVESDEAWATREGLPSFEEPFLQKYLDARDNLIAQEKAQRSDHVFRETLSPMAREASIIVSAIREQEQQTLWQTSVEDELAETTQGPIFPGMMFTLAKERMEMSRLWKIVRKMPKGALLHCHLFAMGDMHKLLDFAFDTPGLCIYSDHSLHTKELRFNHRYPFSFCYAKPESTQSSTSLWTESYKTNDKVPISTAAESFPDAGKEGFIKCFISRATIAEEESISQHLGPNAIWEKFISCFGTVRGLVRYEPIFRKFMQHVLSALYEDGVRWVDIRSDFSAPYYAEGSETPEADDFLLLEHMEDEIEKFKSSPEGQGFWGARLIWTTIRHGPPKVIVEDMKRCIAMKQEFPELLGGYDLVGQEDLGRPLTDLLPELFWFKKSCAEHGVDIPFFFHAAETLGDGDSVDENIYDAILLGTRRIGHGLTLYRHPLLCEMVKDKKILIESCPVSNEVLRFTGSIMSNVLPALLARGVPCSLSNDDPGILGQGASGMSHDFWQALQGWENLGLPGLASLAENSVRWANYEDCTAKGWKQSIHDGAYGKDVRAQRLKEFAAEFEKFCEWVVSEFATDVDISTLD